jgi:hypothetical protein
MNPDRLKLLLAAIGIGGIVSGFVTYFLSYRDPRQRKLAFVKSAVREGFEPSAPFWGAAL